MIIPGLLGAAVVTTFIILAAPHMKERFAQRTAAAAAIVLAIAVVSAFAYQGKFALPFAVAPALLIATAYAYHRNVRGFDTGVLCGGSFWAGVWTEDAFRQIQYELHTVGHVTAQYDACSVALGPYVVAFFIVMILGLGGIAAIFRLRLPMPLLALACLVACGTGVHYGATLGWHDWQINQPCF